MLPKHLYFADVPGLEEAIMAVDYAEITSRTLENVMAEIQRGRICAAKYHDAWFVEAPPICQDKLEAIYQRRRREEEAQRHREEDNTRRREEEVRRRADENRRREQEAQRQRDDDTRAREEAAGRRAEEERRRQERSQEKDRTSGQHPNPEQAHLATLGLTREELLRRSRRTPEVCSSEVTHRG